MTLFEIQFHPGFLGCCTPPHVKPPQNLVKFGAKLAFPRWNSVITNQIGKHNGKLNRKLYHFSSQLSKKISQRISPSIFVVPKMVLLLRSSWDFRELFGPKHVADEGMMMFPPRSQCCGLTWHCIQGPWGVWWQCSEIRRSGLEGDGPGWGRMHFPQGFPHGFTGFKRGQRCTEFGNSVHFFPGTHVFESGRV